MPPTDHEHRNLDVVEAPLDAANQSLSDALRTSFGILKLIMVFLCVLYAFSNVQCVDSHEQALKLRMGVLQPGVHEAGLVWAFPFPIDEVLPLPTRKSNDLRVDSHTFQRHKGEEGKPLAMISRSIGAGLNPQRDGALMTADKGLVHMRWKVTYKIKNVADYATHILGTGLEAADRLIQTLVESVGTQVATEMTADELIRTRVDDARAEMLLRINRRLDRLASGIRVARIEAFEPTPPVSIRKAFEDTQSAENRKQQHIRQAEQQATELLSAAAGSSYKRVLSILDHIQAGGTAEKTVEEWRSDLAGVLENLVEGEAGKRIKAAGAYFTQVVARMQSDVELYRTLLPEWNHNPDLLIARLFEQMRQDVFNQDGVTKLYRPAGSEIRIRIPLDPELARLQEEKRLRGKEPDVESLRPQKWIAIGPEYD